MKRKKLNSQREEIGSKIEFNRKEITFLEFQEKINSKDKILKKILKNRDSKLIDSLDFVTGIDESSIVEIQRNGITTYTARVYTKTDSINDFTNLLVKNSGNETEIHFFRYFPSEDYQMAMLNSITQPFEGVIQSLDKDGYVKDEIVVIEGETQSRSAPAQCTFSFDLVWRCNFGANHPPGYPNCHGGSVVIGYNVRWTCTSGPGGGGSNNPDPNPNPGSGGSGDGGDDECYDCLPTEPIPGEEECTTSLCTLDTVLEPNALEAGTRLWMSSQYRQALLSDVLDFIIYENDNSNESKLFSIEGMEAERNGGEVDFEDKIINELKGKEKCLDNLLKESGNDFVKNMIANFVGDDSEFGINIKSKDNVYYTDEDGEISEVSGITKYSSDSNIIKIEISTLKANSRRALQVTRTLLHEYIHADIFRKVYSDSINSEIENFRKTYNDYKNTKFQPTASHQTMAELYLNSMKEALKNFHRQAMVGDYNFLSNNGQNNLDDFYEAIAWQGLRNQNVDAWINLSQDRKEEIDDAYQQYIFAATYNCPN